MNGETSLEDPATSGGLPKRQPADISHGDERTLGGGDDGAGLDAVLDDLDVVNLESGYKVGGTLALGVMNAVLLTTDTRLGRNVAIKRIVGEAAGKQMAAQRFLTEGQAIAALNQPNVVHIHDYGRTKNGAFPIMKYADGGSLLMRYRESALPLEEALDLAWHVCDRLAKAHDLGIVHRDIEPANVFLTKHGVRKLPDVGLAKATAGEHRYTMTGAVLGTPDFPGPKQRRDAAEIDHCSDFWSLAATFS